MYSVCMHLFTQAFYPNKYIIFALTTLRRLTFIQTPNFAWQTYGWRLSRNLVFVCVDRMTSISATVDRFLRTDFLGVHGMSRLDTRQQWTSSLFSWMLCLIPLSKTCSFDWLGWNFYRRINLHCHEAFHMKGESRLDLFDRALIPGLAVA